MQDPKTQKPVRQPKLPYKMSQFKSSLPITGRSRAKAAPKTSGRAGSLQITSGRCGASSPVLGAPKGCVFAGAKRVRATFP